MTETEVQRLTTQGWVEFAKGNRGAADMEDANEQPSPHPGAHAARARTLRRHAARRRPSRGGAGRVREIAAARAEPLSGPVRRGPGGGAGGQPRQGAPVLLEARRDGRAGRARPPSCKRSGSTWRKTKPGARRSTIGSPPSSPSKRYRDTPLARAGPPRAHRHNLGIRHWRTNKDEPTNKNAARTGSRTAWISYLEAANRRCPELKGGILRSRRQPDSGARRGSRAPWSCGAGPARARESGTTFSVAATALVAPASQHYRTLLTTQMCSILERLSTEGRRTAGL